MTTPNNASNVSIGQPKVGGAVFSAPKGTTLPQSAATELGATFNNLGYMNDAGITNTETREISSIFAWGGDEVQSVQASRSETFAFVAIETNLTVLQEAYNPDNVSVDETSKEIKVAHNGKEAPERVFVFDTVLKDGRLQRVVVPKAKRTVLGELIYNNTDPIGYAITLTALPSDDDGNTAFTYILPAVAEDGE